MDYPNEKNQNHDEAQVENDLKILENNIFRDKDLDLLHVSRLDTANHGDIAKKTSSLKYLIEKDQKAADLKWSLFVAACNTYRWDTCLKPFPPMYIKNECKDIESLREQVESIPPLAVVFRKLQEPNIYTNFGPAIELLYWVLIRLRNPYIKTLNKECYDSILKRVSPELSVARPNLIFQVVNVKQSGSKDRWKNIAQGHLTLYAYHGSRLENFHSIIHYGLQQHMCKQDLYGEGIYLSKDLGVSLPYSRMGYGWGGSILGSEMSCVALCELIDHADVMIGASDNNARNLVMDSVGGRVPKQYYLVRNSELVRVRYLLVYSQESRLTRHTNNTGLMSWFKQHKLLTFVLGYVVLLTSVGLTHNKQVERYYKLFIQKVGMD